jgi:hypothetical protein
VTASTVPELLVWLRNRSRGAKIVLVPRRVDEPAITTAGVLDDALVALAATGTAAAVPDPPPEGVLEDLHADLVDIAERLRNGRDVGPTRLIRAVGLAAQALEPQAVTCTGIAARWCPLCGACTCVPDSDTDFEEPTCPVHGGASPHPHAANRPPDIRDLLTDGLRQALATEGLEGDQLEEAVRDLGDLARSEGRRLRAAAARAEAAGHPRPTSNASTGDPT